jgi:alkylation response protein AidB-like acyl-CoA dehydrogenase
MTQYVAPLRDIRFVREELLDIHSLYETLPGYEEATPDLVNSVLEEGAKICEEVLAPLNAVGDEQGCQCVDGEVTTPEGFVEAYRTFIEGGWGSMDRPVEYGGGGLPESVGLVMQEMVGSANWAWGMYPGLSHGAINTLLAHGSDEQKALYLTRLVEGTWTATMCLTEPDAGTDLGLLRTKAEPAADGTYRLSGTKIFVSSGEHDFTENIIHIVLARMPDAPAGTKGISLFIVPKFLVGEDGSLGERNAVRCGSIEHKMGIRGNATCELNFDGAVGYLVGGPNRGLGCMFTFMNTARLGTALQGLAHTELAFQNSLAYAKERLQMRSASGAKQPDSPADPIIVHPDVRRMLLTQKAFAEGARMLIGYSSMLVDISHNSPSDEARAEAEDLLALLTPIAKAFVTETGFEAANLGLQCFGGHGYIRDWGMEQNVRDARIATLYEGTSGVQALDLLGRKVLASKGALLERFTRQIEQFCQANREDPELKPFVTRLEELNQQWGELWVQIGAENAKNRDEMGAAAFDFLMYSGYVTYAYLWARAAAVCCAALGRGGGDAAFYKAKLRTARFYYERILPRTSTLVETMRSGVANLMGEEGDCFDL